MKSLKVITKGIFKKRNYIELPKEIYNNLEVINNIPVLYESHNEKTMVVASDIESMNKKSGTITSILGEEGYDAIILSRTGNTMEYGKATGFFKFKNHIYYKPNTKGAVATEVYTGESFTKSLQENYPNTYGNLRPKEVSLIEVELLRPESFEE